MSEEKKPKKAKTSSTKKATTSKKPVKKETSTKKTTTKKVAKKKVEKVTPVEEQEISIVTAVPEYQATVKLEENNMNNEEIKVTEEPKEEIEEVVVPKYQEPIQIDEPVDIPTIPVYEEPIQIQEPVNNVYTEPANEGYKATRLSETNNEVVEEPTTFAYNESTPAVEPINIETDNYNEFVPPVNNYEPVEIHEEDNTDITIEPVYQENVVFEPNIESAMPVYNESTQVENNSEYNYTEPTIEVPINNEPMVEPTVIQEPVVKQKKKKDIRTILLVILFIFLFAFTMGMPYINELIDNLKKDTGLSEIERKAKEIEKEELKQNPRVKETDDGEVVKDKLSTLKCTSTTTALENYDVTVVEKFNYNSKGQVLESSKTTTYKFNTQNDTYNNLKTQCNENSLKYVEKKGYEVACSYNDTEVEMEDKYDLATFTTINDGIVTIEANAKYKEKIDSIKERLTSLNYICE